MTREVLVVVPARGGSKRLPGKHLRPLRGRSLLAWTDRAIREAGLDAPLLTTDDAAIAAEGRRLGWLVPFLRPAALASDEASTADAVIHALDAHAEWSGEADPDLVMLLQTTSPLRPSRLLVDGLSRMRAADRPDAVISATRIKVGGRYLFAADACGRLSALGVADAAPMVPNGALYVIRTACLRDRRSFFPVDLAAIETGPLESIDIDTEEDWIMAEAIAAARGL